jgi:hypothetical protein
MIAVSMITNARLGEPNAEKGEVGSPRTAGNSSVLQGWSPDRVSIATPQVPMWTAWCMGGFRRTGSGSMSAGAHRVVATDQGAKGVAPAGEVGRRIGNKHREVLSTGAMYR